MNFVGLTVETRLRDPSGLCHRADRCAFSWRCFLEPSTGPSVQDQFRSELRTCKISHTISAQKEGLGYFWHSLIPIQSVFISLSMSNQCADHYLHMCEWKMSSGHRDSYLWWPHQCHAERAWKNTQLTTHPCNSPKKSDEDDSPESRHSETFHTPCTVTPTPDMPWTMTPLATGTQDKVKASAKCQVLYTEWPAFGTWFKMLIAIAIFLLRHPPPCGPIPSSCKYI